MTDNYRVETYAKGRRHLEMAEVNSGYSIYDAYERPCRENVMAWEKCKRICEDEDGWDFHICRHSSWNFTVAWKTTKGTRVKTAHGSYLVLNKE